MELHCVPAETPTGSACSSDPIYDNCLPQAQSRKRLSHMQSSVLGARSPQPGLVPAHPVGATVTGEARGPGLWPDHSYCSWRGVLGRPGCGSGLGARGGDREEGILWREQDRAPQKRSPSPSHSTEHRSALSFYDNIPEPVTPDNLPLFAMETQEHLYQAWAPQALPEPEEEESLERSPWSSCEIVLPDSKELELLPEPELCSQVCQTEPWPTAEAEERLPPPVPVADPGASALRSLLTGLQQQIVRQRVDYEQRITSLEQRNEELQVEVIRLKSNLAQQRHWYQVVQAKILESERARAAAEQRNATLQREMEQFFDTFGELNKEAKKTEYIAKSF